MTPDLAGMAEEIHHHVTTRLRWRFLQKRVEANDAAVALFFETPEDGFVVVTVEPASFGKGYA